VLLKASSGLKATRILYKHLPLFWYLATMDSMWMDQHCGRHWRVYELPDVQGDRIEIERRLTVRFHRSETSVFQTSFHAAFRAIARDYVWWTSALARDRQRIQDLRDVKLLEKLRCARGVLIGLDSRPKLITFLGVAKVAGIPPATANHFAARRRELTREFIETPQGLVLRKIAWVLCEVLARKVEATTVKNLAIHAHIPSSRGNYRLLGDALEERFIQLNYKRPGPKPGNTAAAA
jgi:hypothetical protein